MELLARQGGGKPVNDHENQAPIYFKSLELENVRCFAQPQRLDLSNEHGNPVQWVLILGDNGVGKTTLLQCLAWMRPVPSIVKTEDDVGRDIFSAEPALNNEENETWESLIRVGAEVTVNLKATLSVGQSLGNRGVNSTNKTVTTAATMTGMNGQLQDIISPKQDIPNTLQEASLPNLAIFAYGAARRSGTLKVDRGARSDALASLFWASTELYDAEDILLKLDHRAAKPGKQQVIDRKRLDRVKEILATILPDIEHEDNIKILGPAIFSPSSEPDGVRFQTPYGLVPLSALSLGYQTTLTWVVDLALRLFEHYSESPDPLSEPGIVLIDNIDLHLHPRWQQRVMENLSNCFRAIQFVATAHSPLIVQAAEDAVIAVLRKENEQVGGSQNPLQGVEGLCKPLNLHEPERLWRGRRAILRTSQVIIERHSESVNTWRADQILASDLFDIPTRSKAVEKLARERDELLDKLDRTQAEEDRLNKLTQKLDSLRTAEDPEDHAAMELIRSVAASLKEDGSDRS